jgi:glycerol-3-phosphate acyltransferase PlsY
VTPSISVAAALAAGAYLAGTFPTAELVGRRFGVDPAHEGSGNPGASNVYRLAGARAGAVVLVIDVAKGALPALAGRLLGGVELAVVLGAFAVLGHCFPVTRRFHGGKGVATAGGLLLAVEPLLALAAGAIWAAIARGLHRASVASLVAVLATLASLVALGRPGVEVGVFAGVVALIVVRHKANLERLVHGQERALDPAAEDEPRKGGGARPPGEGVGPPRP